jgi:hypothetical protein
MISVTFSRGPISKAHSAHTQHMNNKVIPILAVGAGFIGGMISGRLQPASVYAQAPAQNELRAQRFVVVDASGKPRGAFGLDENGDAILEVIDRKGRPDWPRWRKRRVADFDSRPLLVPPR